MPATTQVLAQQRPQVHTLPHRPAAAAPTSQLLRQTRAHSPRARSPQGVCWALPCIHQTPRFQRSEYYTCYVLNRSQIPRLQTIHAIRYTVHPNVWTGKTTLFTQVSGQGRLCGAPIPCPAGGALAGFLDAAGRAGEPPAAAAAAAASVSSAPRACSSVDAHCSALAAAPSVPLAEQMVATLSISQNPSCHISAQQSWNISFVVDVTNPGQIFCSC